MSMSENEWLKMFGNNLRYLLDEYCVTQKDLAEMTGLAEGTISEYVRGNKMPGAKALLAISYALDESVDDLIDFGERIEG